MRRGPLCRACNDRLLPQRSKFFVAEIEYCYVDGGASADQATFRIEWQIPDATDSLWRLSLSRKIAVKNVRRRNRKEALVDSQKEDGSVTGSRATEKHSLEEPEIANVIAGPSVQPMSETRLQEFDTFSWRERVEPTAGWRIWSVNSLV